jgi:hypothetical protein
VRIHQEGFVGDFLVGGNTRTRTFSVLELARAVLDIGWEPESASAYHYAMMFLVFCILFSWIRLLGMVFMCVRSLSLRKAANLFTALEVISAWASLDVLVFLLAVLYYELPMVTSQMTGSATPRAKELVLDIFASSEKTFFDSRLTFLQGFWFMLFVVCLEKVVVHFCTGLFVACIKERIQATEDSDWLVFSPGVRYVFANLGYAGLPVRFWGWLLRVGVLDEIVNDEAGGYL